MEFMRNINISCLCCKNMAKKGIKFVKHKLINHTMKLNEKAKNIYDLLFSILQFSSCLNKMQILFQYITGLID